MKYASYHLFSGIAYQYMDETAKEDTYTAVHKGYTIVPHKILRCYGLSQYEKLILIDLISFMGDKSSCYPTKETIARNVGCSSKSVERHIRSLKEKGLIYINEGNRNHEYYLPRNFHQHPYLLMSEKTHEFINEVRRAVNERELTHWIDGIVKEEVYQKFLSRLMSLCNHPFGSSFSKNEIVSDLADYKTYLEAEYNKKFTTSDNQSE